MEKNLNKEFVKTVTNNFAEYCNKKYGFVPNYEELRRITVDLLFGEYMHFAEGQSKEEVEKIITEATNESIETGE